MTTSFKAEKNKLIHDLQAVIQDTEELLRMTVDHVGESADALRSRVSDRLNQAKLLGQEGEDFVKNNPWKSVGVAAGVGLLLGLLVGRR